MVLGSDGELAGSGPNLDVVPPLDQVVVGAPPVGLPPGGPDAEVVDGQLRRSAPPAPPRPGPPAGRHHPSVGGPPPTRVLGATLGASPPHLVLGGPPVNP